eukprot:scaffold27129_cov73-Attheya_sp.AAC.1
MSSRTRIVKIRVCKKMREHFTPLGSARYLRGPLREAGSLLSRERERLPHSIHRPPLCPP